MSEISRSISLRFLLLFASISLHFIAGFSNDSASSKNDAKTKPNVTSGRSSGLKLVIILLGIVAIGLLLFFLFKMWRKKKREEQYARLLKLFEEDDQLEVELGLKD